MNTYCLGTLVTFGSFDHEREGHVNISVSVGDMAGLRMTAEWITEILDVNDAPSVGAIDLPSKTRLGLRIFI